jgi:hypothetical protein
MTSGGRQFWQTLPPLRRNANLFRKRSRIRRRQKPRFFLFFRFGGFLLT